MCGEYFVFAFVLEKNSQIFVSVAPQASYAVSGMSSSCCKSSTLLLVDGLLIRISSTFRSALTRMVSKRFEKLSIPFRSCDRKSRNSAEMESVVRY